MVVISILAILLTIILPLFNTSRDMSYRAQCASNLKQLSAAFNLYATDWSGYWPALGGLRGDWTYWSQSGPGGLNSYVKQRGVKTIWCCPLQDTWNGAYSARTYSMNGYLRTPWDHEYEEGNTILCGINADRIQSSSKTILLYEGALLDKPYKFSLDYIYRCANWTWVQGYSNRPGSSQPWHGRFNNYLYCDGHVVARKPGKAIAGLSTGSEMYQWYVDKNYFMSDLWAKNWSRTAPWE